MKRALIAAAVVAGVSGLLTTPDLITQIFTAGVSFAAILGILFVCLRFIPMERWSLAKQRTFTWLVAGAIGVFFVLMPSAIRLLSR
jgi:multisubunit Na+/H+ antiporter MnhB subunit